MLRFPDNNRLYLAAFMLLLGAAGTAPEVAAQGAEGAVVLTLDECLRAAGESNADIRGAALDLRAAELQREEAFAEYFPRVSATGFGFYSLNPLLDIGIKDILGDNELSNNLQDLITTAGAEFGIPPRYTAMQHGYLLGVVAMQPLYAGGRIVNGNRLAELGVKAAGLSADMQKRKTLQGIEQAWWQAASLEDKKVTLERVISIMEELKSSVDAAVGAGLAAETDALQLELRSSETRAALRQVESGQKLIKMSILNSAGIEYSLLRSLSDEDRPYIDDISLDFSSDEPLSPEHYRKDEQEIVSSLAERQLLDLQVDANRLQKKMALGEALPQVAVGVAAGYSDFLGRGRADALAVATISIPLSDWGKTSKKVQRLQTQVQKAEEQRDYLDRQLSLKVASLWVELEARYDALLNSEESLDIATRLFEVARQNYAAGLIGISDLLTAEASYRQAASERADALIAYRNAVKAYQEPVVSLTS